MVSVVNNKQQYIMPRTKGAKNKPKFIHVTFEKLNRVLGSNPRSKIAISADYAVFFNPKMIENRLKAKKQLASI